MIFTGKKVVSGMAAGPVYLLKEQELKIEEGLNTDCEKEISRLTLALEKAREELREIHTKVSQSIGSEEAEIIEAHLMMLEDPDFIDGIHQKIQSDRMFATKALKFTSDEMAQIFEAMDNEYMRQRAHDIRDITRRVMSALSGFSDKIDLPDGCILVTQELKPSVLSSLDHKKIAGILTTVDGRNSHTAILSRSLEIPTMMAVAGIHQKVQTHDVIAFNSDSEKIYLNPNEEVRSQIEKEKAEWNKNRTELLKLKNQTSTYKGEKITLLANINSPSELGLVEKYGAEGIGLFRTEFIYMDRETAPTEEEQFKIYTDVLKAVHPKPCTIRTLDVGGDKEIPYLKIGKEENPFLGLRAIRYCLKHPEFFKVQLRALLRASVHGNLKIMLPMITNVSEITETKKLIEEVKVELGTVGKYELGIMVEIPAVAVMADEFAKHVDFFSLGTNDLTQYTCAVDRMNEEIRDLYDSGHPAVLKLIEMTIQAAGKNKIGVSVCGEMAGQLVFTQTLLKLGLKHFSMSPSQVLPVRALIK